MSNSIRPRIDPIIKGRVSVDKKELKGVLKGVKRAYKSAWEEDALSVLNEIASIKSEIERWSK